SGNHTTIIPADRVTAADRLISEPQPTNGLPTPPQVGLIVDATNATYYSQNPTNNLIKTNFLKFTMPDNDVAEIDVATLAVSRYFPRVGTVNLGLAIRPGS